MMADVLFEELISGGFGDYAIKPAYGDITCSGDVFDVYDPGF